MSEIKAATKFLGNSQFKQFCHITSELIELWIAWILWKIGLGTVINVICESIDLQSSVQTFQECSLGWNEFLIKYFRRKVYEKNESRGYYTQQSTPD